MADGEVNFSIEETLGPVLTTTYIRDEFIDTLKYLKFTDPALRAIDNIVTVASFGIWAFDASGAAVSRSIAGGSGVTVTNGTGVAGNPTVSLTAKNMAAIAISTLLDATNDYVFADATAGSLNVNLPAAASNSGKVYVIKKTDAGGNTVTIDPNSAELVDGAATLVLTSANEVKTIISNGVSWYTV